MSIWINRSGTSLAVAFLFLVICFVALVCPSSSYADNLRDHELAMALDRDSGGFVVLHDLEIMQACVERSSLAKSHSFKKGLEVVVGRLNAISKLDAAISDIRSVSDVTSKLEFVGVCFPKKATSEVVGKFNPVPLPLPGEGTRYDQEAFNAVFVVKGDEAFVSQIFEVHRLLREASFEDGSPILPIDIRHASSKGEYLVMGDQAARCESFLSCLVKKSKEKNLTDSRSFQQAMNCLGKSSDSEFLRGFISIRNGPSWLHFFSSEFAYDRESYSRNLAGFGFQANVVNPETLHGNMVPVARLEACVHHLVPASETARLLDSLREIQFIPNLPFEMVVIRGSTWSMHDKNVAEKEIERAMGVVGNEDRKSLLEFFTAESSSRKGEFQASQFQAVYSKEANGVVEIYHLPRMNKKAVESAFLKYQKSVGVRELFDEVNSDHGILFELSADDVCRHFLCIDGFFVSASKRLMKKIAPALGEKSSVLHEHLQVVKKITGCKSCCSIDSYNLAGKATPDQIRDQSEGNQQDFVHGLFLDSILSCFAKRTSLLENLQNDNFAKVYGVVFVNN